MGQIASPERNIWFWGKFWSQEELDTFKTDVERLAGTVVLQETVIQETNRPRTIDRDDETPKDIPERGEE